MMSQTMDQMMKQASEKMKQTNEKRAQAAVEFLITYGWAIFLILIAITALASMGLFNLSNLVPDSCTAQAGLECVDMRPPQREEMAIMLMLRNGLGQNIELLSGSALSGQGCDLSRLEASLDGSGYADLSSSTLTVPNTQAVWLRLTCDSYAGSTVKAGLSLRYRNLVSGVDHTAVVSIRARVD